MRGPQLPQLPQPHMEQSEEESEGGQGGGGRLRVPPGNPVHAQGARMHATFQLGRCLTPLTYPRSKRPGSIFVFTEQCVFK